MNEQEQLMQIISAISEKTGEAPEKVVAMLQEIMQTKGQEGVKAFIDKVLNPKAEMFKKGGKMEAAVNKLKCGGKAIEKHENGKAIKAYNKGWLTPWWLAFALADETDLPMREGTTDRRKYKKVVSPSGEIRDRVLKQYGEYHAPATTERIIKDGDTVFIYNGVKYRPGDDMYDRYTKAWQDYGVYEKGGKVKKCQNGESLSSRKISEIIDIPNGQIYETEDGYFDVDGRAVRYENKIENIKDRHNSAKQEVFTDGRTAYIMTTGKDLDLFNNYTGDRDTLIQVVRGFKNPKKFENESLGHKFEVAFPGIAELLGYKSGYQEHLDNINELKKKK